MTTTTLTLLFKMPKSTICSNKHIEVAHFYQGCNRYEGTEAVVEAIKQAIRDSEGKMTQSSAGCLPVEFESL